MWKQLAEEIFFFQYHMHLPMAASMTLPINLRKWMIERYIEQKEKEHEAMEAQRRKASAGVKKR
jgi:hypothetical protein